jgi:ABC-type Fe3+ transport system substrate-binding protein
LAEAWVEFLLSPEIQQFILDNKIGNPVITDIKNAGVSAKTSNIPAMENADTYIAENANIIKEKFSDIFN